LAEEKTSGVDANRKSTPELRRGEVKEGGSLQSAYSLEGTYATPFNLLEVQLKGWGKKWTI